MTSESLPTGGIAQIRIAPDSEALAHLAASWLFGRATETRGEFSLAVGGGSTPRRLYEILASPPYREGFPWRTTHMFWGDERFVPHDHELSNVRLVRETLLRHVPIPEENVHVPPHRVSPEHSAAMYQRMLELHYGGAVVCADRPLFDVNLLGLGTDGHTASLFPGTAALGEDRAWVAAVTGGVALPRITLTFPAIAASASVAFLVSGASKAAVLRGVLGGDWALPAARVTARGEVVWFVDEAALV